MGGRMVPTTAVIMPSISYFYNVFAANVYVALVLKGMQAGVAAVILDVVCSMGGKVIASHSAVSLFLMVAAFAANYIFGVNVVLIILAAALFGVVRAALTRKRTV